MKAGKSLRRSSREDGNEEEAKPGDLLRNGKRHPRWEERPVHVDERSFFCMLLYRISGGILRMQQDVLFLFLAYSDFTHPNIIPIYIS